MNRPFTGYHMTTILVGFFGIVIAVNLLMAHFATSTFGGALAENGYVASQDYNRLIAESEAQAKLGWGVDASAEEDHLLLTVTGVRDPIITVVAEHPLGREDAATLTMTRAADGRYRSNERLPEGRWKLIITLAAQGNTANYLQEVGR